MKFSYALTKKLFPRLPVRAKFVETLNMHSFETADAGGDVLEITLPTNRYSDAASHIGIAREAAAVSGRRFVSPVKLIVNPPTGHGLLEVEIERSKFCPRYSARYLEIKKMENSPQWMQKILQSCGLKPVNNIVDLMNYVMLETGQPLHAFDADKLAGRKSKKIIVRRARKSEKIETLDGQRFTLDPDMLLIADSKGPLAIAGIKGGGYSGVYSGTKHIIVEAANFDPVSIYKTSRRLKLFTDAAVRFSHGISPALVQIGMDRATELLRKMGAKLLDSVDAYPKPVGEEVIEFNPRNYEELVGAKISLAKVKKYFQALGFSIRNQKSPPAGRAGEIRNQKFMAHIPPWRTDIENPEDLAEEVARLEGYNSLKPKAPLVALKPAEEEDAVILKDRLRSALVNLRLSEAYNYSFVAEGGKEAVELENPVSSEFRYLRTSLEAGLLRNVRDNARFFDRIRIFEIGKAFRQGRSGVIERLSLGVVLAAKKEPLTLELKGICDTLFKNLGLEEFRFTEVGDALRIESDHAVLGQIKIAHLEKSWVAAVAEIDADKLLKLIEEEREFKPLPKYPAIVRDVSILVSDEIRIGDVIQLIQETNPKIVEDVDLIDEYTDEKLGGKQSLTFRIIFQAEDRTLTDKEVNKEMERINAALKRKFRAEIR